MKMRMGLKVVSEMPLGIDGVVGELVWILTKRVGPKSPLRLNSELSTHTIVASNTMMRLIKVGFVLS